MNAEQPKPKRHLWLDLEDTIITPVQNGWFNVQLINVQKIKAFIEEWKPNFMHVFSFAVWDEQQLLRFNMGPRPRIEDALGMKFSAIPTVDGEIIPTACSLLGISPDAVSFQDASDFWGKHESFRLNMRHLYRNNTEEVEVAFFDDAVFNEEFYWPDIKVRGRIILMDPLLKEIPKELQTFSFLRHVKLSETGELELHITTSSTEKDNRNHLFFIEEELNSLGFTMSKTFCTDTVISALIVCR